MDVADDRFAGLFESEKFALDPTDPRFRETKAATFIAEERARRRSEKSSASLLEKKKKTRENGDARKKREKNRTTKTRAARATSRCARWSKG